MKRVVGIVLAGLVGVGTLFSGGGVAHAEEKEVVEEVVTEEIVTKEVKEESEEVVKTTEEETLEESTDAVESEIVINNQITLTNKQEKSEEIQSPDNNELLEEESYEDRVLSDFGLGGGATDDYPVIVVPGILGSRLYDSKGVKIWDSLFAGELDINTNPIALTYNNDINQANTSSREYGAGNIYKILVDSLCDKFDNVYFFSYDWRKDNSQTAVDLAGQIEYVKNECKTNKVNIVAHSMGGLVTSRYIKNQGTNSINRIITCGTPYEGAPSLLHRTLTKSTLNDWRDIFLGLLGVVPEVKKQLPSMSQLSPTNELYNYEPAWNLSKLVTKVEKRLVKTKAGMTLGGGGDPTKEGSVMEIVQEIPVKEKSKLDYNGFSDIGRKIYGNNYNIAENFKNSIKRNGINELYYLDNTYFVVGINQATIVSGTFDTNDNKNYSLIEVDYDNMGDGTVPYHSATIFEKLKNKGTDNNGMSRYLQISTDHGGTVQNNKAIDYIITVLQGKNKNIQSDKLKGGACTKVTIQCPVDVVIEKNGEVLSSADGKIKTSFGQIDYLGETGDIKSVYLEDGWEDDNYNISLNGSGGGVMDLTLSWYMDGGDKIEERQFLQIPVTEKTIMSTDTNRYDVSMLNVDSDGDGTIDDTWYSWDGDVGYRIEEETQEETTQPSEEQNKETQPATTEKQASASTAQPASVVKAATAATSATTAAAKTGDTNLTALWITLSSVSAGIMGVIIVALKKRRLD